MKILNQLIETYKSDTLVKSVVVGKHNVLVEGAKGGMASTLTTDSKDIDFTNKTLSDLMNLAFNDNLFETAIGIAALNSAIPINNDKLRKINAKHLIFEKGKGKNVAVIGHFPFVDKMGKDFNKFIVFEQNPTGDDYHSSEIPNLLPEMDVVAITGSTFINKTFLDVMEHVNSNAFVIVLGPSTPVSEILFDYGVNAVCGSVITDIETVKSQMKFSKHFRDLQGIEGVSLIKE